MAVGFLYNEFMDNEGIIVPEGFKNSICFGQTGSGKTTGYILPNIQKRLELGHAIIAFDFKGNLHSHIKILAKEAGRLADVVEIGPLWGHKINILDKIATKDIESWYRSLFGHSSKYGYWEIAACNLLKTLYGIERFLFHANGILGQICHYCDGVEPLTQTFVYPSFSSIGAALNLTILKTLFANFQTMSRYLIFILENHSLRDVDRHYLLSLLNDMEQYQPFLNRYAKLKDNEDGEEHGNYGVISCLMNTIQDGINCEAINTGFFDIQEMVTEKKIIIIYADTLGDNISRLLNERIFKFLIRRTIFLKEIQPVSIFIDEAHKILTPNTLPEVSLCRENCFEYIMSVQDRILLENTLGVDKVNEMMVNIAHQVSFKNDNISACVNLETFHYKTLGNYSRSGKAKPIFFKKDQMRQVVVEYQRNLCVFDRFSDRAQEEGYLVHDVEKMGDSIAIYIDRDGGAEEIKIYDKELLEKKHLKLISHKQPHYDKVSSVKENIKVNDAELKSALKEFISLITKEFTKFKENMHEDHKKELSYIWKEIEDIQKNLEKYNK
ncbi:hypothetical protein CCZ01_03720 [Helicobacter monodelphidis]|uniref:type IV secretory system conjugative DNA transfer family protein n=1 Tax=Helicobacter sp. 15-1451 TaxID=2004995 RepID=UPI000DCB2A33|nr:type IV secretory system conjugative DNA transfer family protein [Helicobacter sp. 15-1451]RAX58193.1 hypothetical protein CCZ01_03720 [Helicobacter sp. 15-1451]